MKTNRQRSESNSSGDLTVHLQYGLFQINTQKLAIDLGKVSDSLDMYSKSKSWDHKFIKHFKITSGDHVQQV